ncbi:hypothetical protein HELRODRAFT_182826 [Helobdella robusta]|uniref:Uncharacterized protein n=1 Tax=Helobdella robusta TaxID=6412 RepID=T1FIT5_HELRO|nr:hypothetical protein HELRODRAFT_182826 [Helobdella robusta]ESN90130.1 hypothetical protein HELRODRAFT_182826 [Helobdella robusta]
MSKSLKTTVPDVEINDTVNDAQQQIKHTSTSSTTPNPLSGTKLPKNAYQNKTINLTTDQTFHSNYQIIFGSLAKRFSRPPYQDLLLTLIFTTSKFILTKSIFPYIYSKEH